jgi:hypothetical protein
MSLQTFNLGIMNKTTTSDGSIHGLLKCLLIHATCGSGHDGSIWTSP